MKIMIRGNKIKIIILTLLAAWLVITAYRYSPYKLEYLGYYDKIWAHRVNSKEKLNYALKFFDGIELDLVYDADKNILDVNHPPAPSIDLDLQEYLSKINTDKYPYIWLDIKNLTIENDENILDILVALFSEREYPFGKILVESQNSLSLPIFARAGFKTSYYLPTGLSTKNTSDLEIEIKKIKEILKAQPTVSISSNYEDYEFMRTHFPKTKKYTWIINSVFTHGFSEPRRILRDPTVEAVLIRYKSFSGN